MLLPYAEPYKIKAIERIRNLTREERIDCIKQAKFNLFNIKSKNVFVDLLTDSGTGAMSDRQWAEVMLGDESYAGSASFDKMKESVSRITGFSHVLPTHQGRAAENVLFSAFLKEGDLVPGNSHFDTTKGHIEFRKAKAVDCTIDEAFITDLEHPFKGNVDIRKLKKVIDSTPQGRIPLCLLTVTCNSSGGQPVSMENIREVSELCRKNNIPLFFDGARFAENAYYIKQREQGYGDKTIKDIVLEMFSYGSGMTMSSKKDALVNMGGFLALKNLEDYSRCAPFTIIYEGYLTYGGLSGRDMGALAQGLEEGTEYETLHARISQVLYLGEKLHSYGIPCQRPIGGHAVFVDAVKFLPKVPREEFSAQTLAVELYIEAGVRGVEIGTLLADRDPETRENRYPALEFLRLAVPRQVYTYNHMDYTAAGLRNVWERRDEITRGFTLLKEAPILRHFTMELAPLGEY